MADLLTQSKQETYVGDRSRPWKFVDSSCERWVQAAVPAKSNCGLGEHYFGGIIDGYIVGICLGK